MVMKGTKGDAYQSFLNRSETSISLVVINGVPRYGHESLMNKWTTAKESVKVNKTKYKIYLQQATADQVVGNLKLSAAIKRLKDGLNDLPALAKKLETSPHRALSILNADASPQWFLVLDHNDELQGEKLRLEAAVAPVRRAPSKPLSAIVEKMKLDSITVADDKNFLTGIKSQKNLPQYLKEGLEKMYK